MAGPDDKFAEHRRYLENSYEKLEFEALEHPVDEETFSRVVRDAHEAVTSAGIAYVLIGGLASTVWGRPRWTHDIDFLVRPNDARKTLEALELAGFKTNETDSTWLFKAIKDGVLVDVLFKMMGDIYLDDDMLAHARPAEIYGATLPVVAPEDLIVIKVSAFAEEMPRHWWDALGLAAASDLDWDYLQRRSMRSARRVLSLLLFAQSNDVAVPDVVIDDLLRMVRGDADKNEP